MSLSAILFLFLVHLRRRHYPGAGLGRARGGGEVLSLQRRHGRAAHRHRFRAADRTLTNPSTLHTAATASLVVAEAALVVYWATIGRMLAKIRPAAAVDGDRVPASCRVTLQALDISRDAPGLMPLLTVASFLSSVALLGGACGAMVLGHWYLVVPSLDVAHLQSIVRLHIGSTVVRVVVVAAAVMIAIVTWQPGVPNFERYIFSIDGIFFWQRVLFGLAGPAVLSYLTWETAKIQSTQSATGILYVDFFTVIVGEVLAKYLLLSTKVPV